jgi:hypothetical protein
MAYCCQKWVYTVHGDDVVAFYPLERGKLQSKRSLYRSIGLFLTARCAVLHSHQGTAINESISAKRKRVPEPVI